MEARTIADAFVYLLSRALVVRQEHLDRTEEGFAYNQIRYNPRGRADSANPHFGIAYLEGWIAVDDEHPAILEVPQVKDRYYRAQILDEWGEVIANINEHTFPSKPFGKFALCKPGSEARLRSDTARIDLHSAKARLLGRVELKGDAAGTAALQKKFMLTAQGTPKVGPPPDIPVFPDDKLIGEELFDFADGLMISALDVSARAADMQQQVRAVAAHIAWSPKARQEAGRLLRETVIPEFIEFVLTRAPPSHGGWAGGSPVLGNFDCTYWLRAAANYAGIQASMPDEVIFFATASDAASATTVKAI